MIKYFLRIPGAGYLHFKGSGAHTYLTMVSLDEATALADEEHAIRAADHATEFLITGDYVEIVKMFFRDRTNEENDE
jgi:hypothetical protein